MEFFYLLWFGALIYLVAGLTIPSFFKKDRRTLIKFYKLYSLLGSIYVCSSCIYSVSSYFLYYLYSTLLSFTSDEYSYDQEAQSGLPFLLAMTQFQTYPLVFCFLDYWADIGLFVRGVRCDMLEEDTIKFHHSLAIIGIAFELYYWIGGGMMMCLLMDTVEVVFSMAEDVVSEFMPGVLTRSMRRSWAKVCWMLWLIFRLVWYCVVSVWSLATMVGYYFFFSSKDQTGDAGGGMKIGLFGLMTLCWVLYANWDHFTQFMFHYRHDTNNLHEVLTMLHVPLPAHAAPGYVKRAVTQHTTTTTHTTPTTKPTTTQTQKKDK